MTSFTLAKLRQVDEVHVQLHGGASEPPAASATALRFSSVSKISSFIGFLSSGPDCNFQNSIAPWTEEIVRLDDLIQCKGCE